MDDLMTWFRTQLDDVERVARAAAGRTGHLWLASPDGDISGGDTLPCGGVFVLDNVALARTGVEADHIALWNPKRALAYVDATRQVIAEYEEAHEFYRRVQQAPAGEIAGLHTAIRYAALPLSDQPGYREEWRP